MNEHHMKLKQLAAAGVCIAFIGLAPASRLMASASADVVPPLPVTVPPLPVTVPPLPVTVPTLPGTTPATNPPPHCDNFAISPAHPQWGQTVTLTPKGSFGDHTGRITVYPLNADGSRNTNNSADLPLHNGTWRSDSLLVDLPQTPPDPNVDSTGWIIALANDQVSCTLNIPVLRILDCSRLAWSAENAFRLLASVVDAQKGEQPPSQFRNDPVGVDLGPADKVKLNYTRLLDSNSNQPVPTSLTDVLNQAGGAIGFAFNLADGRPEEFSTQAGQFGYPGSNVPPDSQSTNLTVLPRPVLVPADTSAADRDQYRPLTRTLNLDARITLPSNLCQSGSPGPIVVHLLSINLIQKPMVLPTIAVFFQDANYAGDALAVVQTGPNAPQIPGVPLPPPGTKLDGNSDATALRNNVNLVAAALNLLQVQADILRPNFTAGLPQASRDGSLVPLPNAGQINLAAAQLTGSQHPALVAGAGAVRYTLSQLRRDPCCFWANWDKILSSVSVVGFPNANHAVASKNDVYFCGFGCDLNHWSSTDYGVGGGSLVRQVPYMGNDWNDRIELLDMS